MIWSIFLLMGLIAVAFFFVMTRNWHSNKKIDEYILVMRECAEKKAEVEMLDLLYPNLDPIEKFKRMTKIYYPDDDFEDEK